MADAKLVGRMSVQEFRSGASAMWTCSSSSISVWYASAEANSGMYGTAG